MFTSRFPGKGASFFGVILLTFLIVPTGFCSTGESLPLEGRYAVSAAIGRDRATYHIAKSESGLTADNQAQSYGAVFSPQGVEVRTGSAAFGLELTGYGYGGDIKPIEPAVPVASQNRVEYRRGTLTEWYVNGPFGLQQGFTLAEAPAGRSDGQTLRVALKIRGGLTARVDPDGRGLALVNDGGAAVFQYGGLTVLDADNRAVPARLEVEADRLSIEVNDSSAQYPLTIDPIIERSKLTASDGAAGDNFGYTVAVDGDTVVVGANQAGIGGNVEQGAAYVFVKNGVVWTQTAKLTASDGDEYVNFGISVSVSGDTIAVGAYLDYQRGTDTGSAYVFAKNGGVWTQTAKLTASDAAVGDMFGYSVSVSGDTIAVGALGDDGSGGGGSEYGSAYVFVKNGVVWTQTAKLTASDGAIMDLFGQSVSVSGDTIAVGAWGDDDRGLNSGSAYVFAKPDGGWADTTETAKLTASDGAAGDFFGQSVSVSGDTIAVGAWGDDDLGADSGSAYVFAKNGGAWTQTAKLIASDGAVGDWFGQSVSISGNTIAVGSPKDDDRGAGSGSAYVFVKNGDVWTESAKLTASDGAVGDRFGDSVSVSGGTVAVGAQYDDIGGNVDQGSSYVIDILHNLVAATAGSGLGTVVSQPAGIFCPGTCGSQWLRGATVALSAFPAFGSALVGWTGAPCPGNGDCSFEVTGDITVTAEFIADMDADGVGDAVEDAGPNGGDGNGDGVRDSRQPFVTTFQDVNGMWNTLVADSGAPLVQVIAMPDPDPAGRPAHVTAPCGLFQFKVQGLAPGATTLITLIMHTADPTVNSYWKYGPTPANAADHWYEFRYDGTVGAEIEHDGGKTYVNLNLKDGALGDADGLANGEIDDPGAPAVDSTIITGGGGGGGGGGGVTPVTPGAGGGGGGGCFVSFEN